MKSPDLRALLEVARSSIESGLRTGRPLAPDPLSYPEPLRAVRASFVTLHRDAELRGCIGGLEPLRPLVADVAEHAFAAAFRDPRFAPLVEEELAGLAVSISVLSTLEPLAVASEDELLAWLRPGVDGLVLEANGRRGTFLPAVWESLPDPRTFLRELKRKAGLAPDFWSEALRVRRYTVESVS
jgi:AmmeMemoRadiSam system protein A